MSSTRSDIHLTRLATCHICPHFCRLAEGEHGLCRARVCKNGKVIDENYGRLTSIALDPIEKKPLACYQSGSWVLSVGSYGCNLACPFCQNASIACAGQDNVAWRSVSPEQLIDQANTLRDQGNIGIAYTYNEPLVGFEFVYDCSKLARQVGLKNIIVSNGMINPGPLGELIDFIDAANIDLKGFTEDFYRWIGGDLRTVKHTIEAMATAPHCHLEVTTLIIPDINDSEETIDAMAKWLASLDPTIPYHISRFFPCHHLKDRPPTPVDTVYHLVDVARRHLENVFSGNC